MEQQFDFTVSDLASKWRSKTELYNVLTREGKLYPPPMKDWTQKFIRSLMRGEKEYVRCSAVNIINVPHYKGLRVRDIVDFARTKVNITSYLPDYNYVKDPNREWVWNIVNSLIPKEFQEFIQQKEDERRKELLESSNLAIQIKPDFFKEIFKSSQAVSIVKGKSHYKHKVSKKD